MESTASDRPLPICLYTPNYPPRNLIARESGLYHLPICAPTPHFGRGRRPRCTTTLVSLAERARFHNSQRSQSLHRPNPSTGAPVNEDDAERQGRHSHTEGGYAVSWVFSGGYFVWGPRVGTRSSPLLPSVYHLCGITSSRQVFFRIDLYRARTSYLEMGRDLLLLEDRADATRL